MANHGNHGPGNDVIEVLDDDLLEEAELILEEGESDEFEDEATAVYDPDQHDGGFEDEATRVFDPGAADDGEFPDEATQVWQSPAPEPAPRAAAQPARPARGGSPFTVQLPQAGMAEVRRPVAASAPEAFDEERTVITDSASLYGAAAAPRSTGRQQVVRPAPAAAAPRGRSPWVPALALLLVGGLAAAAILYFGRTPAPVEPTTGPVLLATTPSGATVTVNGQRYANTTPTTLPDLEVGETYALLLELDGYEPIQDVVVPTEELLPKEYVFEMTAASMTVRTVPAGAQIAVDGVARGISPLTIPSLDPQAPHTVVATLEGHEPATRSVSFTATGPREQLVSLSLVPLPPAEASGEGSGDAALAAGEGEEAQEPASEPVAQRTRTTERASERDEPTRTRPTEERTERTERTERPSTRERPTRTNTRERPSTTRERPSRIAPAEPAGFGTLSVQAVPFGQVWVDGRMVSPETPLINHRLEAGSHRIKVYYVNLRQFSDERTVRIEPDGNRTVTFRAAQ